uniref:NADH-ubiquinone oxidoreductase chain 4L n=1 Tax=Stereophaedusa caloptyx subtilis TaxID=1885697 RepID=A0A224AAD7_9EUPU|nr:NADH dehydrogenase subunit 4L [Stereophaedusa caloptyx subtilis]
MKFPLFLLVLLVMLFLFLFNTKSHYLRALLILETMMLTALIISFFLMVTLMENPFQFLLLLTFGVVEAGFGLSLLLTFIKNGGSDMIKTNLF